MGQGSRALIVHLFIPDDGRLDPATLDEPYRSRIPQLPAQEDIDEQAGAASVTVHPGPLTSATIDDLMPPEPGETWIVVPSNGRGPIPAGAIAVHRSFPDQNATGVLGVRNDDEQCTFFRKLRAARSLPGSAVRGWEKRMVHGEGGLAP